MRSVLSISIPPKKLASIKKMAKSQGMTISAYIIHKIDEDMEHLITEEELLEYAKEAQNDLRLGKVKTLRSPEDLLLSELP